MKLLRNSLMISRKEILRYIQIHVCRAYSDIYIYSVNENQKPEIITKIDEANKQTTIKTNTEQNNNNKQTKKERILNTPFTLLWPSSVLLHYFRMLYFDIQNNTL